MVVLYEKQTGTNGGSVGSVGGNDNLQKYMNSRR